MYFSRPGACCILIIALCSLLTPYSLLHTSIYASDEPFTYPSNWGGTGLMEIPTARVMKENSFRVGASQVFPYRYFYGAVSPLKGLEIDGRIMEFIEFTFAKQKTSKDKVINFKYQFYPEGKYMPALAIGIMDPHGTRLYPSQYIAASKQVYPFDFTVGFGNGRFGKRPLTIHTENIKVEMFSDPAGWLRDSQFFGGIQFSPSEKFALMVEYNPIKYHKQTGDPAQPENFTEPVPLKYNFGIRYKPTKWSEIDLSYQRGNEFGVNLSLAFDIGKPLIPIYNPVYREKFPDLHNSVENRIAKALYKSGFSDIGVRINDGEIWIAAQNEKYFFSAGALGIIIRIIAQVNPGNVENIHIMLHEKGVPLIGISSLKADIIDLHNDKLTVNEFLYLSQINTAAYKKFSSHRKFKKSVRYGISPSLETFLNDPSGFFKYRFGVSGWTSYHPWEGASLVAAVSSYPLNNISTSNDPLSIPVRSDIVLFKKRDFVLSRLMYDQIYKFGGKVYGRLSAGLLEVQYAGIDAELAMPVLDGRVLLGISGSAVKKRDPDNALQIKNNDIKGTFNTYFFNSRLNIPEIETAIDVKAGRFLAGDDGVRFTVSKFIKGVTLWAWYSFTDTDIFSDRFNRGYHDKGIGVSIPLRLFIGTDSRTTFKYALSPWTRDTGQDINHYNPLFNFIGRNTKIFLDKDNKMLY